jgi:ankyrin repeat protein
MVIDLINYNSIFDSINLFGLTPLQAAVECDNEEIVELLVGNGASVLVINHVSILLSLMIVMLNISLMY